MTLLLASILLADSLESKEYFVTVFASQDGHRRVASPRRAHCFATWIETSNGEVTGRFTISWCATSRFRLFKRAELGVNITLEESLARYSARGMRISRWGPFKIKKDFYTRARRQYDRLEDAERTGAVRYKALDGRTRFRARRLAFNCMHAIADTSGVTLRTGTQRGDMVSQTIVEHFKSLGLITEPDRSHEWVWNAVKSDEYVVVKRDRSIEVHESEPAFVVTAER